MATTGSAMSLSDSPSDRSRISFSVYRHPAFDQALQFRNQQPSMSDMILSVTLLACSVFALFSISQWTPQILSVFGGLGLSEFTTGVLLKSAQIVLSLLLVAAFSGIYVAASYKDPTQYKSAHAFHSKQVLAAGPPENQQAPCPANLIPLSERQLSLLGAKAVEASLLSDEKLDKREVEVEKSSGQEEITLPKAGVRTIPPGTNQQQSSPLMVPVHSAIRKSLSGASPEKSPLWTNEVLQSPLTYAGSPPLGSYDRSGFSYASPSRFSNPATISYPPSSATPPQSRSFKLHLNEGVPSFQTRQSQIDSEEQLEDYLAAVDSGLAISSPPVSLPPAGFRTPGIISGFGAKSSPRSFQLPFSSGGLKSPLYLHDPGYFTGSPSLAFGSSGDRSLGSLRPATLTPDYTKGSPSGGLSPSLLYSGSSVKKISPKRKDGEFPEPMALEEAEGAFQKYGVAAEIDSWRDNIRQWFAEQLLQPLWGKILASHSEVSVAALKLGISVTLGPMGGPPFTSESPILVADVLGGRMGSLQGQLMPEEQMLQTLRTFLTQAKEKAQAPAQPSLFAPPNQQQQAQVGEQQLLISACLEAVLARERLGSLLRGDCLKGMLLGSTMLEDYAVQRIRDLAEGTCVKNYLWDAGGDWTPPASGSLPPTSTSIATPSFFEAASTPFLPSTPPPASSPASFKQSWSQELPDDTHLLAYLFFAHVEIPGWQFHIDSATSSPAPAGRNPVFLGRLPAKERAPKQYVAVLPTAPYAAGLTPGACILSVSKEVAPRMALYWDRKLQFCLQGRTALWDSLILLVRHIQVVHGGTIRGLKLDSPVLNLHSVFRPS